MKKLELKHLSPYLPYGLKVEMLDFDIMTKLMGIEQPNEEMRIQPLIELTVGKRLELMYKPILRPLSDLTKEIEVNGEKFIPANKLFDNKHPDFIKALVDKLFLSEIETNLSYARIRKLFEWHFNVFDLPKELWIDINTLKK